ncbi:hypothetical protein ACGLWX_11900 [Halomonas sp. HMF6819]|uniref:hypothetical protein n=1 Tax=Halomonas sp. HMF6819 TaxID=3373085 RepID=UPI0037B6A00B
MYTDENALNSAATLPDTANFNEFSSLKNVTGNSTRRGRAQTVRDTFFTHQRKTYSTFVYSACILNAVSCPRAISPMALFFTRDLHTDAFSSRPTKGVLLDETIGSRR